MSRWYTQKLIRFASFGCELSACKSLLAKILSPGCGFIPIESCGRKSISSTQFCLELVGISGIYPAHGDRGICGEIGRAGRVRDHRGSRIRI